MSSNNMRFNKGFDEFEDISSYSDGYTDEFEDISSYSSEDIRFSDYQYEQASPQRGQVPPQRGQVYTNYPKSKESYLQDEPKSQKNQKKRKKRRKHRIRRAITAVFLAGLIFFGILSAVAVNMINKMNFNEEIAENRTNPYIDESSLYSDKDVLNILLLGVDAREGETVSRSDTMILVSIDKIHEKIKMTSFLRDSYVEIPGHGWNKLNASSTKGGVELVMNTIEYNYKIQIDNYMLVDFAAFEELIDAVGGVNIEVTEKEANYLNNTWYQWSLTGNQLTFESGKDVELNGEEALMFCRIRKLDSDFYRTERQRRVISGVIEKLTANPTKIMSVANSVLPLIETDIKTAETMKLALNAVSYVSYGMAQMSIPADGTWHSERKSCGDSLVFDIDENAAILKDFIYFDEYDGKEEEATIAE